MADWKRGELQAFSWAAKFLLFMGLLIVVFGGYDREWLFVTLGAGMAAAGLVIGFWLIRYQKRTGRSAKPFRR